MEDNIEASRMLSYVPNRSFLSQYPAWGNWQANSYKTLPASRGIKQQGALLFLEGKVSDLSPLEDRDGFGAGVDEGKLYGSSVWLDDTGELHFECGCARPRKEELCPHALAVLAAVDYLFFERNHLPLSPLSNHVEQLAAGIDRSSGDTHENLRRICFCGLKDREFYLEGDAPFDDSFIQAINPYGEMRRLASNTLELPMHNARKTLRTLVDYVRDSLNLRLEAELPEGSYLALKPELCAVGARLHFIADQAQATVRIIELPEELEKEDILVTLDAKHHILRDGRIVYIDEQLNQPLQNAFIQHETGFSDFERECNEFSMDHYNHCVFRLDASARRRLRQCHFSVIPHRGEDPVPASEDLPVMDMKLQLELRNIEGGHSSDYEVSIDGYLDGDLYTLNSFFFDFLNKLIEYSSDANRLLGRKARYDAIIDAAAQLPLIPTEAARRKFINKTCRKAIFAKPEHKRAVGQFLRQIEQDYCRSKSCLVQMCLPADVMDEDSPYRWHPVDLPLPALLALTAKLYQHSRSYDPYETNYAGIKITHGKNTLTELAEICNRYGVTLRIDDKTTTVRPTMVEALISNSTEIDWFELKTSVRCDGFEIPPEDWERLIGGSLILEGEDGPLLAPSITDSGALDALIRTLSSKQQADRPDQIHRLQMLDWITLRQSGVSLEMPEELEGLFQSLKDFEGIPEQPLPQTVKAELRPYQKQGFDWLVFLHKHRLGACLADDMGLGKTLQTLCLVAYLKARAAKKHPLRALAVLPTSLLFNWENEAKRFTPDLTVASYSGKDRDPAIFDQTELVLTSYDLLWRDLDHFTDRSFDLVIFDEAQAMKNPKSRRTQSASKLDRRFTLCLTGTPMENHPGEFHTIMDIALPGLMGTRKQFDEALRSGEEHLLRRARPFLLRRSKDTILKELPPKVESDIHLEMNEVQRGIYTKIVKTLRGEVTQAYAKQTKGRASICALAALTKLRQICVCPALLGHRLEEPSPKIQHLVDSLLELREEGQSVLIFSQFVKVLDIIQNALAEATIQTLRLDGSTPSDKRRQAVEHFQNSENPEVFLISLKAGGTGLNLTRASHIFHVDPWWNPAVENQASDRAHRIGQQQTVFVQRLIMLDSIEEKIMTLKARKKELFRAIVEDPTTKRKKTTAITKEDFEFLLSP